MYNKNFSTLKRVTEYNLSNNSRIAKLTKRIEKAKRIKDKELLNKTLKEANAFLHDQKAAELLREHQNKMPLPYENQE